MCELFGISGLKEVDAGPWLETFFSHSGKNPHGWGMAQFHAPVPSADPLSDRFGAGMGVLEKEPCRAEKSAYLKSRLRRGVCVSSMIGHIREATIGSLDYCNTHPFMRCDGTGRCWTLAHNGTVFEGASLHDFIDEQEGQTDSERILIGLVHRIDLAGAEIKRRLTARERCRVVDDFLAALAPGNKLNLLLFDGELFYVHTNLQGTLYQCSVDGSRLFVTVPFLTGHSSHWEELPLTALCAFRAGTLFYQGQPHGHIYVEDPEKIRSLMMAYAGL